MLLLGQFPFQHGDAPVEAIFLHLVIAQAYVVVVQLAGEHVDDGPVHLGLHVRLLLEGGVELTLLYGEDRTRLGHLHGRRPRLARDDAHFTQCRHRENGGDFEPLRRHHCCFSREQHVHLVARRSALTNVVASVTALVGAQSENFLDLGRREPFEDGDLAKHLDQELLFLDGCLRRHLSAYSVGCFSSRRQNIGATNRLHQAPVSIRWRPMAAKTMLAD